MKSFILEEIRLTTSWINLREHKKKTLVEFSFPNQTPVSKTYSKAKSLSFIEYIFNNSLPAYQTHPVTDQLAVR